MRITDMHFQYALTEFAQGVDIAKFAEQIRASSITVALDYVATDGANANVVFKAAVAIAEEDALTALVATHDGTPAAQPAREVQIAGVVVRDGLLSIATHKSVEDNDPVMSHNFCDKTTWYQGSQYFSGSLERNTSADPARVWYKIPNGQGGYRTNVIDTEHGKISSLEDTLNPAYKLKVYVNGVQKSISKPWQAGECTVDYKNGEIEFAVDPGEGATVTCEGYIAGASKFKFYAPPNRKWQIDAVELQFSESARLDVPVHFDTIIYQKDGNGIPTVPLNLGAGPVHAVAARVYKTKWLLVLEANKYYFIPLSEGDTITGIQESIHVHGWEYKGVKPLTNKLQIPGLPNDYAVVLEIYTEGDVELTGSLAAVTLYTLTIDA